MSDQYCGKNDKMSRHQKNVTWNRTAVTGILLAAMAAPLVIMPGRAQADLSSAINSGNYGPAVTIVAPQYADIVKGTTSIAIAVQQRSNPVQAVQMFIDGHLATPGWTPLKSLQSSKFNWDTTRFNNGPHKLTVRVADSRGLIGQAEITVYVNNGAAQSAQGDDAAAPTAPYLKWLGISDGQTLKGTVNLQLQASNKFGVKYIFVMLNSVNDPDSKPALRSWMINQPPYVISFDTTKVNDGQYVLDALAYDALSNEGAAPRLHIGIANNSINPTWYNQVAPEEKATETTTSANDSANTANTDNSSKTASTENSTESAPSQTESSPQNNGGNNGASTTNHTSTVQFGNAPAQFSIPNLPQRSGALNRGSDNSSNREESNAESENNLANNAPLEVTVNGSAEVRNATTQAAPRLSELPTKLAPEPAQSAKSTSSKNTKTGNAQSLTAREAAVPTLSESTFTSNALDNLSAPRPTLKNTPGPDAVLSDANTSLAHQRIAMADDAFSQPRAVAHVQNIPHNTIKRVPEKIAKNKQISNVALPEFPQATLRSSGENAPKESRKLTATPKSTFTGSPSPSIVETNINGRIASTTRSAQNTTEFVTNAQMGALPQHIRMASRTENSAINHVAKRGGDLRAEAHQAMVPQSTTAISPLTQSRLASASLAGNTWNYQRKMENNENAGQETRPQIAFLPDFSAQKAPSRTSTSIPSITVSPINPTMQVSENTRAWPSVYVTKTSEPLAAVAQRYGLPVQIIAASNGLSASTQLKPGQKLQMPRNLQVTYNGKSIQSDVDAMQVGATSVAAFRFLFEQQGGSVKWDAATQTVHAKNGATEVTLTIGSDRAMVNQKEVMMDLAAFLLSGRTMVPVRLFEQALHAQVTWDPATGRMFMAMAGSNS